MIKEKYFLIPKFLVFSFFLLIVLSSCYSLKDNMIIENDAVKSVKRIKNTFHYHDAIEKRSPLHFLRKIFVKEIDEDKNIDYTVYDVLYLNESSYKLENKVYVIIDGDVVPIKHTLEGNKIVQRINPETKTIQALDSSYVSVTTGYDTYNQKISNISYKLDNEVINKMIVASDIRYRYYSGEYMITIKMTKRDINKLKEITQTN